MSASIEQRLAKSQAAVEAAPDDAGARFELGYSLALAGDLDRATAEYVVAWRLPQAEGAPDLLGIFAGQIKRLIARHPPSRLPFVALQDELAPPSDGPPDRSTFASWVRLNAMLGEPHRTLAWFDAIYPKLPAEPRLAALVDNVLVRPLMECGRWADAGRVMVDPIARIRQIVFKPLEAAVAMPPETSERIDALGRRGRVLFASMFVRALLAAHRDVDARAVAEYCRGVDPSSEMVDALRSLGVA
jgi:hypothetical protein